MAPREAGRFAERNATALQQRPSWLFSVSSIGHQESFVPPRVARVLRAIRKEAPEITALRSTIHPREHRNFAGAIARTEGARHRCGPRGQVDDHDLRRPTMRWGPHTRSIVDDANGAWPRFSGRT